jgi:ATP-binding cassette subfamily B protein
MMAIQYIIGQLNGPVEQLIGFVRSTQDAHLSLERLNEVHQQEDEEPEKQHFLYTLPANKNIEIKNLSFTYPGAGNEAVLKNINLEIPEGKTTAIVGMSGSGKTTLLKLLLKFYKLDSGTIHLGRLNLSNISHRSWRRHCGVVMQDGFIFSDSIARNIAVGEEHPDMPKLLHAVKVANIQEFIESLPLGFNTKIGSEGNSISQGQKQRILIARAVYKDPEFIFFDEATNALDANNERAIMENLQDFFENRTVVVVAHRLSTVKNADNIVVLEKGEIIEQGTHQELAGMQGAYFELVKNQLELGA